MTPECNRRPTLSLPSAANLRPSETTPLVSAISKAIRQIPRGRVSTYGAVAKAAGYPRCARHVARVLKLVDGLPWQRVLGSGGRISLRGELAMEQRFLLEAEGVRFKGRRVDMKAYEHRFQRTDASGKSRGKVAGRQRVPRK
jgi:methylated-DNA-protein-cysteine methyltransferase-like protein